MIFGSTSSLAFEVAPLEPSWPLRAVSDLGPWASLKIVSRGRNLTRCVSPDSEQVFESVCVPLLPVASWFIENAKSLLWEEFPVDFKQDLILHDCLEKWNEIDAPPGIDQESFEDSRFAWYSRHFLLAGAEGALLPDLAFARIDNRLYLSWRQPKFAGPRQLEFIEQPGTHHHAWGDAWEAISRFVSYVAEQSRRREIALAWAQHDQPLEEASRTTPEQYFQYVSPTALPLLEKLSISQDAEPGAHPALLSVRDLSVTDSNVDEIAAALGFLQEGGDERADELRQLRASFQGSYPPRPEESGYSAAGVLRQRMSLDGQPLETDQLRELIDNIAIVKDQASDSDKNNFALGFAPQQSAKVVFFSHARMIKQWAARMEAARALGHLLLDQETNRGALGAASSHSARGPRRRRSGAFAAELLMPEHGIRQFIGNNSPSQPDVFEDLLSHFKVGALTAAYHLWNKNLISTEEDRDALIDRYARTPENAE